MRNTKIEYVYVLTNKSFGETMVKIGFTDDPKRRAKELHSTSLPHPFEIAYAVPVYKAFELEQTVHKALERHRVNNDREFFDCGVSTAVNTIRTYLPQYSNTLTREVDETYTGYYKPELTLQDQLLAKQRGADAGVKFQGAENPYLSTTVRSHAYAAGCADPRVFNSFQAGWLAGLERQEELYELEQSNEKVRRCTLARGDGSKAFDTFYRLNEQLDYTIETRHNAAIKSGYQSGSYEYDLFLKSWDDCCLEWKQALAKKKR